MLDCVNVADFPSTKLAVAIQVAEVVNANPIPAVPWHDYPMFGGVAPFAKRLAFGKIILPRKTIRNVTLVMDLQNNSIVRRPAAVGTESSMKLYHILAKLNPHSVLILFHQAPYSVASCW